MNILRIKYKAQDGTLAVERMIPETDLISFISKEIAPKLPTRCKSTISIEPVGKMDDIYIKSDYTEVEEEQLNDSVF